jgi:nitroreductase
MTLCVAANAMGLRTAWLTEWMAYDRRILDALGLTPGERLAGFVHVGRAAQTPPDRPRPELSAVVTRF